MDLGLALALWRAQRSLGVTVDWLEIGEVRPNLEQHSRQIAGSAKHAP